MAQGPATDESKTAVPPTVSQALGVPSTAPGVHFTHIATTTNTVGNATYLDHPLLNDNQDARIIVTQNWNPQGTAGTYNAQVVAVWYDSLAMRWGIFNEDDLVPMPEGASFNVYIPVNDGTILLHETTADNINGNYTLIEHPMLDNNPEATIFVTHNWNPPGENRRL